MPARINRLTSMPLPRRASAATKTAVANPATKPRLGAIAGETPAMIASTIAVAAPALTPVR